MEQIRVDHSTLSKDFLNHLLIAENKRTILTGPFGTGKSTFLNEIDDMISNQEDRDFVFIKLQPVNYSIASSDDVFDLIKYDIFIELLDKYGDRMELAPYVFPFLLTAQMFIQDQFSLPKIFKTTSLAIEHLTEFEEYLEPIGPFIKLGSKLNRPITALVEEYKKYKQLVSENKDKKLIEAFMQDQENQKSHHLMDQASLIVKDSIRKICRSFGEKAKSVLIVDDMDRLDPEHIFRLFNIFSAHYDPKDDRNKFGFDKIVFVCDFENIRKIYHHRYGQNVDFSGYIDKFYTLEPFQFDNRRYISDQINKILLVLPVNQEETVESLKVANRSDLRTLLTVVSVILIRSKMLNLRMLSSYPKFSIQSTKIHLAKGLTSYGVIYDFYVMAQVLKRFYSSWEDLLSKLEKLDQFDSQASLASIFPDLDFDNFCEIAGRACFNFVIDYNSTSAPSTSGGRVVTSYDNEIQFEFVGTTAEPRVFYSIKAVSGEFKPFRLIQAAIRRAIDNGVLY